jgi:hypothetical protein
MLVREAREIARQWLLAEAEAIPGFVGAFHTGSVLWLADESVLPATSDVDVMIVLDSAAVPAKLGKLRHQGVILEITYLPRSQVESAEQVLGHYHLASSFYRPNVMLDPTGHLAAVRAVVAREFPRRHRVRQRCEHAAGNISRYLDSLQAAEAVHDQVMSWVFGTGVTTHLPLVAGLKNPTVRQRYLAVRDLLAEYGRLDFYEILLDLLGCPTLSQEQALEHLASLTSAFDAASAAIRTPIFFAADLAPEARPIAIDGSRDLIARGDHREAVFWMVVTYARCLTVFHRDAPELTERHAAGLWRLLGNLGIGGPADLIGRGERVRAFLPQLWEVADAIMAANPAITE